MFAKLFKSFLPHLLVIVGFLILSIIYVSPVLEGKTIIQNDVIQAGGAAQELKKFEKETGTRSLWTNSMFSGMPAYQIYMDYPSSWSVAVGRFLSYQLPIPSPANLIFILLLGFYFLMAVLGFNRWISILGALAFAFSSYNIISIEAGHTSKVLAIGFAPPMIAAVILTFRGKYLLGAALTGLFASIELYTNHIQITYYIVIALGLYTIYALVEAIMKSEIKRFAIAVLVLGLAGILSLGSQTSRFWTTYEYQKETTRGKSDLTAKNENSSSGGLDKDYAFDWSYGITESFTFLVPNFYGGASGGELSRNSATYKELIGKGVDKANADSFVKRLPLYWGDQPFTSGPAYMGAVICFLFVFGFFITKDQMRWWLLGTFVLFLMISWGKNLDWFNYFLFDYFPLYNKFRAVTMILCVIQIFMIILIGLGLQDLLKLEDNQAVAEDSGKNKAMKVKSVMSPEKQAAQKVLLYTGGAVGGLCLVFAVLGSSLFNFSGAGDEGFVANLTQMTKSDTFAQQLMTALESDRLTLMRNDAFRSFFFILFAAGLIYAFLINRLKGTYLIIALGLVILADLWLVDRRYLNNDNFVKKSQYEASFAKTSADNEILKDKDIHYRVFNTSVSPFNDATTSYHHKSIGGYHGAKLKRYNETIEVMIKQLNGDRSNLMDMLNTKYFILKNENKLIAQKNPNALGNAWFVEKYQLVENADEEFAALETLEPKTTALVDKLYEEKLNSLAIQFNDKNTIELTQYSPNELVYETEAKSPQLAVFSEIYYNSGLGWNAYIDDQPVNHFRVNYILRAMVVPEGKHTIVFKFEPKSYYTGSTIDLICSIILFGGIALVFGLNIREALKD